MPTIHIHSRKSQRPGFLPTYSLYPAVMPAHLVFYSSITIILHFIAILHRINSISALQPSIQLVVAECSWPPVRKSTHQSPIIITPSTALSTNTTTSFIHDNKYNVIAIAIWWQVNTRSHASSDHRCLMLIYQLLFHTVHAMLTVVNYRSRDHRQFLSQTSYANIWLMFYCAHPPISHRCEVIQQRVSGSKGKAKDEDKPRGPRLGWRPDA
jgi:hypothetical protein